MKSNKLIMLLVMMAFILSTLFLFGCPVNEEKEDPDLPEMTCARMIDYVYEICGYSFKDTVDGASIALTNDEATDQCEDWEDTPDWEGCSWEHAVNCADDRRKKDDCESWMTCVNDYQPGGQDDDDSEK